MPRPTLEDIAGGKPEVLTLVESNKNLGLGNAFTGDEILEYLSNWCNKNNLSLNQSGELWQILELVGIERLYADANKVQA